MIKKDLKNLYGISHSTLRKLLNVTFYDELKPLGYQKDNRILSPCVVRKFIELYGEPIKKEEL